MRRSLRLTTSILACLALAACGGSGGSGSGGGSGPTPPPTPAINATGVNMGNISTIPTGFGSTTTSIVVTNNLPNQVLLQSATYTLYDSSGAEPAKPTNGAGSPVNTQACSTIQAIGSCPVIVSAPASQGQYLVTMNYLDPVTGKTYTTSQVVSYSAQTPTTATGVIVSTINNVLYNQPGGSTTYSVPFVLTQDFANLTATSADNNPAFAPTISCPNGTFSAGALCTLYVKVSGTGTISSISGNITISSTASSQSTLKNSKIKAVIKGHAGYIFNVPITVVQNVTGNLVTSGVNVVINPSDGTAAQTVTLLNNGNATITGISVIGATPVVVTNSCSTLAAGASCTFTTNVTSSASGQSSVVVTYSNGSTSGNTSGSLSFNVIYIGATAGPAMTLTSGQGSLLNTNINTTAFFNVNVKNTGNVTLSSITFNSNALPAGMTYDSSSTCATNGTASLTAGNSCTLVINYSPTAIASGTYTLREAANWTNSGGQPQTYESASLAIVYSAITGNAFLYITPNYVSFAIRADGHDTESQLFTIVNAGASSTTLSSFDIANPSVTPGGVYTQSAATCTNGMTLAAGASCTVTTLFGTTTSTITNESSQMLATYQPNPSESAVVSFSNLVFNASPAAYITVSSITESGGTGAGTSGSPWIFTNSPAANTQLQITATYQNSGTQDATNFNVALNNLPVGYFIVESPSTCGHGTAVTTLATSATCNVVFTAVNPSGLYNPYSLTGPLNVNIPGFSYQDTSTGFNSNNAPTAVGFTNTLFVTANSFATVAESAASWTTGTAGGTNTLTFTTSGGSPIGTTVQVQTGTLSAFTFTPSNATCTTVALDGSCSMTVQNPAGIPLSTVYFNYIVSPTSGLAGTGIIQSGSFTYTN